MNDYAHGPLEALAWVLGPLEETEDPHRLRRNLEGARDDLLSGVSVNFRDRCENACLSQSSLNAPS